MTHIFTRSVLCALALVVAPFGNAAEKQPPALKLQATKFRVPSGEPPDFGVSDAEWQQKHAHNVTLPAQVFRPGEGKVSPDGPAIQYPETEPSIWRTFARLQSAATANDFDRIKSLFTPDMKRIMDALAEDPRNKQLFTAQNRAFQQIELLLIIDINGN